MPATAATPGQFAGASTGPPSLPAETTINTPLAVAWLIASASVCEQGPVPPKLMLMTFAGCVLGTPATAMPAAQSVAVAISETKPPHFPSTRTGSIWVCQVTPAIPVMLLVIAPRSPAVRVPCQELFCGVPPLHSVGC